MSGDGTQALPEASAIDIDAFDLDETPCHLVRLALKRAYDIFVDEVAHLGLRPPQFTVMITVYQNPGLNQNDLAKLTGSDRSTVAELIGRLEARGCLQRRRARRDHRVNKLYVTEEGERALRRSMPAVARAEARIMELIPAEHRDGFLEALKVLAASDDEPAAGEPPNDRSAAG